MASLSQLVITLPQTHTERDADKVLALLASHVSHGWEEQSLPTGELRFVVYFTVPESAAALSALAAATVPGALIRQSIEDEKDWVEVWKEFFTPVEGGRHFLVLAPWMEKERTETSRIPIIIEPKTAFGTGHHETTALCLAAVSLLADEGKIQPGMRFLDMGTGSGILGLACAKLGLAGEGFDTDLPAVENALENRLINGVSPSDFVVRQGSVEAANGPYNLILANILAQPLRDMAQALTLLRDSQEKHPLLILSGLLDIQADGVAAAYTAYGRETPRRLSRGEWVALLFE